MEKISQVVQLESEDQMDVVTGLSGSGPAYVFYLVESLANAGVELGLSEDMAMRLAKATVAGSGALLMSSSDTLYLGQNCFQIVHSQFKLVIIF